jgi:hypothetical protein
MQESIKEIFLSIQDNPLDVFVVGGVHEVPIHPSSTPPTVLCVKSVIGSVMLLPNVITGLITHTSLIQQLTSPLRTLNLISIGILTTNHLTNDLSNLNIRADEYHGTDQIKVGDSQGLDILHTGLAQLPTSHRNFSLPNLLHVPLIEKNLISVNQFTHDNQVFIEFYPYFFRVKDLHSGNLLLQGPSRAGLYLWPSPSSFTSTRTALIGERVSIDQWHNRLGHPATPLVRRILSKHRLPVVSNKSALLCPACQQGKLHKLHFGASLSVSKDSLDLLYLDVWGPAPLLFSNNKRYFLCIVDDFSKYFWLFPLTYKSDVLAVFTQFKAMVENFLGHSIKSIQTDGGGRVYCFTKISVYLWHFSSQNMPSYSSSKW